ncbi:MAG: PQQ-dependent sugar dehydrogenase [Deltaproteobacteria bacterium]|nr:PQQ-dependent sugar dehydrogenase [Deltaproteobacteria bacterium]
MRAFVVPLLVAAACGGGSSAKHPDAAPAPYCTPKSGTKLKLTEIASGLSSPVLVTAPAGDPRIFILEQPGRIRLIGADGILRDTPYLDLGDACIQTGGEQGLLGLAFHPKFAENGKFYIDYTRASDGAEVIAEYTTTPAAETVTSAPRELIVQEDPASNHNGGMLAFGPDGYLYISIGDGGGGGDSFHNGQNQQTLMAKILRIDVDHPDSGKPYGIPADNPWKAGPGVPEMFVWGLRNPWRFSIDQQTGDVFIGDVGQGTTEEVDVIPHGTSGQNLGWSVFEGDGCFDNNPGCADATPFTPPVVAYNRVNTGQCSVVGGYVYRGACMPDLVGTYFYGDYCSGEIDTFIYAGGAATSKMSRTSDVDPDGLLKGRLSSFGTDGYDELYATAVSSGRVFRIEVE